MDFQSFNVNHLYRTFLNKTVGRLGTHMPNLYGALFHHFLRILLLLAADISLEFILLAPKLP